MYARLTASTVFGTDSLCLFISAVISNRTLRSNEPPSWQLAMILRLIFMLLMCPYIKVITRYLQTQKDIPE